MERNGRILNFISNFKKQVETIYYKFQLEIKFVAVYT